MLVIGVTGGIGSGKTAATDRFQEHGITVVDADLASRVIVEPGRPALQAIAEHFGPHLITADGSLDRRALREIVFADPTQRQWLEQLTHPLIGQEIVAQIQASTSPYTILASPLLLESSQHQMASRILVIDVPVEMQIARTVARDETTEAGVKAIIAAQMSRGERLSKADDVICNDQDLNHLHSEVDRLHQTYLQLARDV
ncbi:MAG: dephospho-CoA kinase [Pseudomonadales bacterium]|jgi:dephospho-CoA kinase|nr:dephospho-CoA kinase [Pseudomonadales bacterium]MEC8811056.1 dephospho-CoA kinase [Pseudomonadota bacterium]TNC88308.1 MAG: dephospho-CoA kinase [Alcanivorax sp.]HAU13316.1 dephospho-CoA kinase [Gammaproteobacteria bacterium]MBI25940.1 dephospho-CoA kinase [Pseudomonadales bacterium]|tara:strand:- start:60500 stop:61099 length:600 start_codon:yes stop_codon:yes gene_type:complete